MQAHVKWFWIVTAANVVVGILSIPLVSGVMLALVGFARFNGSLPPLALPLAGVVLSVVGLILAQRVGTDVARRVRLAVHASALALYTGILIGICALVAMHHK